MTGIHFRSLFVHEKQSEEYNLAVFDWKRIRRYADEQNREIVPSDCFAVERDS